ncbi:variant erythrocyte surface antigen-1, beta subunit [Babesia caballi]|uniref:Variant erythrocyte surface antigen-1, beta subunit n=1 Tax=Babesia caballi TaxID=5871 RepID=A0AAV4LQ02_BABCB|nr:variant erythrocyte surface antigen-1, beta subunit [Babesia caballi]
MVSQSRILMKSLTEEPQNLKESIDWMLRLSGRDNGRFSDGNVAMRGLTRTLLGMIQATKHDFADAVKTTFNEASNLVVKELEVKLRPTHSTFAEYFTNKTNDSTYEKDITSFKNWLESFGECIENGCDPLDQNHVPITDFAKGLELFMGYINGKLTDGFGNRYRYVSAYHPDEASWAAINDSEDKKKQCVRIFLKVVVTIYPLFTLLYWNGWKKTDKYGPKENGVWAEQNLKQSNSELSTFLKAVGFDDFSQINTVYTKTFFCAAHGATTGKMQRCPVDHSVKGSTISGRLQTAFALITHAQCDVSSYQRTRNLTTGGNLYETFDPSKFPFTKLFIVSNAYRITIKSSSITKTVLASAAAVTGVGVSAYLAHISGLLPTMAGLF